MFGATPGVYRNVSAAIMATEAYAKEEDNQWTVVFKDCDGTNWYKTCRVHDIPQAIAEGYSQIETIGGTE